MRTLAFVMFGLLAIVPVAVAEEAPDTFSEHCHDGQKSTDGTPVPCDIDDRVDGQCSFGERDGKGIVVKVGQTVPIPNSCGVVGVFTCDPSASPTIPAANPEAAKRPDPYAVRRAY